MQESRRQTRAAVGYASAARNACRLRENRNAYRIRKMEDWAACGSALMLYHFS